MRALMSRAGKLAAILAARDRMWTRALGYGAAAGIEHLSVLTRLNCRTVVDVGANRGQFALAVRRCCPTARIVSFEPLPEPSAVFRQVFTGDGRTVLHEAAIGPNYQLGLMHVSAKDDSSSLLPISSFQTQMFPGTDEIGTIEVRVAPLAAFVAADEIHEPALLKLDVQGYEMDALRGCESLMGKFRWVYCECSFVELYSGQSLAGDIIQWLDRQGLQVVGIFNAAQNRTGRVVQADFLFGRMRDAAPP